MDSNKIVKIGTTRFCPTFKRKCKCSEGEDRGNSFQYHLSVIENQFTRKNNKGKNNERDELVGQNRWRRIVRARSIFICWDYDVRYNNRASGCCLCRFGFALDRKMLMSAGAIQEVKPTRKWFSATYNITRYRLQFSTSTSNWSYIFFKENVANRLFSYFLLFCNLYLCRHILQINISSSCSVWKKTPTATWTHEFKIVRALTVTISSMQMLPLSGKKWRFKYACVRESCVLCLRLSIL